MQLLEGYEVSQEGNYEVPLPQPATYQDWLQEFRDASQGARPGLELTGEQALVGPGVCLRYGSVKQWTQRNRNDLACMCRMGGSKHIQRNHTAVAALVAIG
jgi:hypothetical protein